MYQALKGGLKEEEKKKKEEKIEIRITHRIKKSCLAYFDMIVVEIKDFITICKPSGPAESFFYCDTMCALCAFDDLP